MNPIFFAIARVGSKSTNSLTFIAGGRHHAYATRAPQPVRTPPPTPSTPPIHPPPPPSTSGACVASVDFLSGILLSSIFGGKLRRCKGVWGCNVRSEITLLRLTRCRWVCSTSPMSCTRPLKSEPHLVSKALHRAGTTTVPPPTTSRSPVSQLCIREPWLEPAGDFSRMPPPPCRHGQRQNQFHHRAACRGTACCQCAQR